ncbi:hypothetical protein FFWV33_08700 [Flavobacterium faecale]|uniref:Competence protein n=1 Tax=Flavobacterium faecale TaxID=1355330 RepID=A0A2S1LDK2_9FLAO|nr:hypothetical protein [Flavobacterium faecale]AWG21606.1 hypothetical protein FFWV33_08700 [Flavobacterium faecale]
METIAANIESLYEKAKSYAEVNVELIKLTAIDKTADVVSSLLARLLVILVVAMFVLFLSISMGLFLGDVLDSPYLGFLAVAGFYLVFALLFHFRRDQIVKVPLTNVIIAKLLKSKTTTNNSKDTQNGSL